ncbi:hypothetical protein [Micromonospora aurantiaca (nom. illeg.)]|uniref:hypothetical protein n=1 Tax=Micromonospora aurantiaca (nom. illeg.) TaxID=47850 RepID=UPI0033E9E4AF
MAAPRLPGPTSDISNGGCRTSYDALSEVGGPSWQPDNDTSRWIRFCLSAHHKQAQLVRQRLDQAAQLWELPDTWLRRNGLPERVASALHLVATDGQYAEPRAP